MSCRVVSCRFMSFRVVSCRFVLCRFVSFSAVFIFFIPIRTYFSKFPFRFVSFRVVSCHFVSFHIVPCRFVSFRVVSFHLFYRFYFLCRFSSLILPALSHLLIPQDFVRIKFIILLYDERQQLSAKQNRLFLSNFSSVKGRIWSH